MLATNALAGTAVERKDIPDNYKWRPDHIYSNIEAWQKDFDFIKTNLDKLAGFKGKFAGPEAKNPAQALIEFNNRSEDIGKKFSNIWVYVMFNYNTDMSNSNWVGRTQMLQQLAVEYGEKLAWVDPEILKIPQATMHKYIDANKGLEPYRKRYDDLYKLQEHVLNETEEAILALAGNVVSNPGTVQEQMTDADMKWGFILDENGDSVEVTDNGWTSWRVNKNRTVREAYFNKLFTGYKDFGNTFAALMSGNVQGDLFYSKARKFDNTLSAALQQRFIPEEVYTNLVQTTRDNCAPLHKYETIRKRMLKVDPYCHWDYYVSFMETPEERFTYEQGVAQVLEALKPLGDKYIADIKIALDANNGWVDPYSHKSKRGGAYSSEAYGVHPFMLYNFDFAKGLTPDDVSTIAHEVGHSMHTWYSEKTQPYAMKDYAIFNAEVASTVNEAIMSTKLLEDARKAYKSAKNPEDKEKARLKLVALLSDQLDAVRQTFYRQVSFAEWEWKVHQMAENNEPITRESLCGLYSDILHHYYGLDAEYGELSSYEWARIPHFYRSYYVFAYSTSYAASIAIAQDILAEYKGDKTKKGARDRYLAYLASGSSKHPVDLLKDAGVDMTTPAPVISFLKYVDGLVIELDALTK
jgi:oligoendopeptidase F